MLSSSKNRLINKVIDFAWSDKISFEEIFSELNLSETEVIKIMRKNLKSKSYRNWRKRVSKRKSKHKKLNEVIDDQSLL